MAEAARARARRAARDGTRRLGEPSAAPPAARAAAGPAARMLHDAPLPPWPGRSAGEIASRLDGECEWLVTNGVLPAGLVTRSRRIAEAALRLWTPVFTHGGLQAAHVFVDLDVIRAWWSLRSLQAVRWLTGHGFDPPLPGCEFAVLRSQL